MKYTTKPFFPPRPDSKDLQPEVERIRSTLDRLVLRPSAITGWQLLCEEECLSCPKCLSAKAFAFGKLLEGTNPGYAKVWEVYEEGNGLAPIGILRLSRIRPATSAHLDFSFFDNQLANKQDLLKELIESVFEDQPDWIAISKLTTELPAHAFSLMRSLRKLGFGGRYSARFGDVKANVDAIIPTEQEHIGDLVLMSMTNGG